MKKTLLGLGAAAIALTAMPASAERHYTNITKCVRYHHGRCVAWKRLTRREARRAGYAVGYRFGPTYSYVDIGALLDPPGVVPVVIKSLVFPASAALGRAAVMRSFASTSRTAY